MDFNKLFTRLILYVFLIIFTAGFTVSAQEVPSAETDSYLEDFEDSGGSEDFGDFEDADIGDDFQDTEETQVEASKLNTSEEDKFYHLQGDFTLSAIDNIAHDKPSAGQTDWRDLSSLKSELFLELDLDLPGSWKMKISGSGFYDAAFSINDRSDYSREIINDDELGGELRKAYISGKITDTIDIKTGRQIVVWGKSDNIRLTDVINPVNIKTPRMTDLEDIRMPLFMTKLDYYFGPWALSGIVVHEKRFDNIPSYGSDFYFYPFKIPENEPTDNFDNTEYAVSLIGTFTGWDASFYYADFYAKTPYFNIGNFNIFNPLLSEFELLYSHQTMVGADVNVALGNFLLKSEAACFKSVDYSDYFDGVNLPVFLQDSYTQIKSLGGIEYTGFTDTTISFEVMNTHIRKFDNAAKAAGNSRNSWETGIRLSRDFFNEKLSATVLAFLYGKNMDEGSIFRVYCDYDLTDNITLTGGAIFYDGSEMALLDLYQDNDRVYGQVEYSF